MYVTIFWYIMIRVQVPSKEHLVCFPKTVARPPLIAVRETHTLENTCSSLLLPYQLQYKSMFTPTHSNKNSLQLQTPTILPVISFASPSHTPWSSEPKINAQLLPSGETCKYLQHHIVEELVQWNETIHIFMCTVHKWFIPMELRHNWGCSSSQHQQKQQQHATNNKRQTTNIYVYLYIYNAYVGQNARQLSKYCQPNTVKTYRL